MLEPPLEAVSNGAWSLDETLAIKFDASEDGGNAEVKELLASIGGGNSSEDGTAPEVKVSPKPESTGGGSSSEDGTTVADDETDGVPSKPGSIGGTVISVGGTAMEDEPVVLLTADESGDSPVEATSLTEPTDASVEGRLLATPVGAFVGSSFEFTDGSLGTGVGSIVVAGTEEVLGTTEVLGIMEELAVEL